MSVTGCQTFGRTFTNEKNSQTGTRVWNIWSTVNLDIDDVLTEAAGFLPQIGDSWDTNGPQGLVAVRQTPIEINREQKFYKVQIDYSTDDSYNTNWNIAMASMKKEYVPWGTKTAFGDPVNVPYFDYGMYLGPAGYGGDEDKFGYPVINRAKDPFEPSIKETRYLTKITLKRVFDKISDMGAAAPSLSIDNLDDLMGWRGTMNTLRIKIGGLWGNPWEFRVDDVQVVRLPQADGSYDTEVTLIIIHDPQTHAKVVLNAGYNQIIDGTTTKNIIRDTSGNKKTQPDLLGPQGEHLADWNYPTGVTGVAEGTQGPPYYIVFPTLEQRNFGDLDLPSEWGD